MLGSWLAYLPVFCRLSHVHSYGARSVLHFASASSDYPLVLVSWFSNIPVIWCLSYVRCCVSRSVLFAVWCLSGIRWCLYLDYSTFLWFDVYPMSRAVLLRVFRFAIQRRRSVRWCLASGWPTFLWFDVYPSSGAMLLGLFCFAVLSFRECALVLGSWLANIPVVRRLSPCSGLCCSECFGLRFNVSRVSVVARFLANRHSCGLTSIPCSRLLFSECFAFRFGFLGVSVGACLLALLHSCGLASVLCPMLRFSECFALRFSAFRLSVGAFLLVVHRSCGLTSIPCSGLCCSRCFASPLGVFGVSVGAYFLADQPFCGLTSILCPMLRCSECFALLFSVSRVCVVLPLSHPVWVPFLFRPACFRFGCFLLGAGEASEGPPRGSSYSRPSRGGRGVTYQSVTPLPLVAPGCPLHLAPSVAGLSFSSLLGGKFSAGCLRATTGCPRGAPRVSVQPPIAHGTRTQRVLPLLRGSLWLDGGPRLLLPAFLWIGVVLGCRLLGFVAKLHVGFLFLETCPILLGFLVLPLVRGGCSADVFTSSSLEPRASRVLGTHSLPSSAGPLFLRSVMPRHLS